MSKETYSLQLSHHAFGTLDRSIAILPSDQVAGAYQAFLSVLHADFLREVRHIHGDNFANSLPGTLSVGATSTQSQTAATAVKTQQIPQEAKLVVNDRTRALFANVRVGRSVVKKQHRASGAQARVDTEARARSTDDTSLEERQIEEQEPPAKRVKVSHSSGAQRRQRAKRQQAWKETA